MNLNGYVKDRHVIRNKRVSLRTFITIVMVAINLVYATAIDTSKTITLNAKNMTLVEVMRIIQKQSGYPFFISGRELAQLPINVNLQNLELPKALDRILLNRDLKWSLEGETIIIQTATARPKAKMSTSILSVDGVKQEKTVRGRVIDEDGEPIAGVTVTIKGTSIATVTESNGGFTIQVRNDQDVLVFSTIGYNTENIPVGNQQTLQLTMTRFVSGLEEVVVVGYSTLSKKEITGSVSIVSVEDMKQVPAANTEQMLQGR